MRTVTMKHLITLKKIKANEDEDGVVTDNAGNVLDRLWVHVKQSTWLSPNMILFIPLLIVFLLFAAWGAREI